MRSFASFPLPCKKKLKRERENLLQGHFCFLVKSTSWHAVLDAGVPALPAMLYVPKSFAL